jgi:hypothetical protein
MGRKTRYRPSPCSTSQTSALREREAHHTRALARQRAESRTVCVRVGQCAAAGYSGWGGRHLTPLIHAVCCAYECASLSQLRLACPAGCAQCHGVRPAVCRGSPTAGRTAGRLGGASSSHRPTPLSTESQRESWSVRVSPSQSESVRVSGCRARRTTRFTREASLVSRFDSHP